MSVPKPTGPAPTAEDKRRRNGTPASYGLAEPVEAGDVGKQPPLGFKPHEMVGSMWKALHNSVEGQFMSTADWQRARIEMWFLNQILTGQAALNATNWGRVQNAMNEMLISPADKRRAGIQMKKATADPDETAAVKTIASYHDKLAS